MNLHATLSICLLTQEKPQLTLHPLFCIPLLSIVIFLSPALSSPTLHPRLILCAVSCNPGLHVAPSTAYFTSPHHPPAQNAKNVRTCTLPHACLHLITTAGTCTWCTLASRTLALRQIPSSPWGRTAESAYPFWMEAYVSGSCRR